MIQPFGFKAARFIRRPPERDALLNILNGAVRSSKTWAVNAKILTLLAGGWWPGGTGLITGTSKTTIKTNVLNDVFNWVGDSNYSYNSQSGDLTLLGRKFLVCGASDERSYKFIKGSTVGVWLGDEITETPKSFFDMAVSRLSLPGSRAYLTTNPANPYHHLKKEWIDNAERIRNGDVWSETWTLLDNPNIPQEKKEQLKRSFSGVFYQRNILGLWVVAEGAIYRDVLTDDVYYEDATRPIALRSRGGHMEHWVGVDYGTINPCVFIDAYDDGDVIWLDREYYYDSRAESRQKTDAEYADDMIQFVGGGDPRSWPGVIIDPSAASFKVELIKRGFYVTDADNDVSGGISKVAAMLSRKKLRINRQGCPNGVREMETYAWDEKKAEKGNEQPIKAHDHYPDNVRYIIKTRVNDWRLAA